VSHSPDSTLPLTEAVQARYGEAARQVLAGSGRASCCGPADAAPRRDPISGDLYDPAVVASLPAEAILASLGCGNPTALADLHEGETVLDLGSGGGIDVLLSARRVGPAGRAYGLDMTDDMLALARANQARAGVENAEFLKGSIERIPLPDASVDVVISNCVINLSGDKRQVLREAFRVLRPGGRFAVADVVTTGPIPDEVRRSMELWVGCLAGALEEGTFRALLAEAGFTGIDVEPTRIYRVEDARDLLCDAGVDADALAPLVDGKFMSAFVRAAKPAARTVAVFDPAMCCSTGVCGPSVDPALTRVAADLDWLRGHGVAVARHNLAQEPAAFAASAPVRDALAAHGPAALPLVLADGAIVASGAYPTRAALARLAGVPLGPAPSKRSIPLGVASEGCCGGDGSAPCC
jgi:2-polyprenyl-3-methyl-5-hydroxy-6-metoxy-1,4-benzoquinol methylase